MESATAMNYPLPIGANPANFANGFGSASLAAFLGIFVTVGLALLAVTIVTCIAVWKINRKAGQPGWAVFVPFYGTIVLLRIGGRPTAWVGLLALPLICALAEWTNGAMAVTDPVGFMMLPVVSFGASLTLSIITGIGLARTFGRSKAFGIWLLGVLPVIGYLMLGLGPSQPCLNSLQLPGGSPDAMPRA